MSIYRNYIAIINNDERHPIELPAKDSAAARKQARNEMFKRGWSKYDGKLTIKVRFA
jgi:hypothetical protein